MKAHVFGVLPDDYKQVRVSFNIKISKMSYKDPRKEIHWFWKI